ncbi:MAG: hypothetical protein K2I72_02435 [Bacilli bacterium]|nr:hypothetical protein [Bacilli bacterium]
MKDLLNDIGIKKIGIIIGVFAAVIVIIVVGLKLFNSFFAGTSYSKIETTMVEAAKAYYEKNPKMLPQMPGGIVTVSSNNLTSNGHMKELSTYTKKIDSSLSCTGNVSVTNINGKYRYTPNLNCGDKYKTSTLVGYIRNQEPLVTSGQGLYELNGGYVFRGDSPNNFVKFANHKWYITKISDDYVYLMFADRADFRSVWDDRYNVERGTNSGINDYLVSRVRTYLENLYNSDQLFSNNDKMLLTPFNLQVGNRGLSDIANDGSIEGSVIVENSYIGILPVYDYINASIDSSCNSAQSNSCANYNYMSYFDFPWWLSNGNRDTTHQAYKISNGTLNSGTANQDSRVLPVVRLVKDALYVSGDGTEADPYVIK